MTHPTGHFQVFFFHKNWDLSYRHIYLGHPLKLKGVGANIILGDFIIVTPRVRLSEAKKTCLWTEHHTWWGGQTKGTTKKQNRVITINACGQALRLFLSFFVKQANGGFATLQLCSEEDDISKKRIIII